MTGPADLSTDDRLLLTDLVHRYAALVDEREAAAVARLFTEDGVLVSPDPPRSLDPVVEHAGRAAIEQVMAAVVALETSVHAITGVVLDAGEEPDTATGRVTCFAHHLARRDDAPYDVVWAVRYQDTYRRTPDGWRFARRVATVDFLDARPVRSVRARPASG